MLPMTGRHHIKFTCRNLNGGRQSEVFDRECEETCAARWRKRRRSERRANVARNRAVVTCEDREAPAEICTETQQFRHRIFTLVLKSRHHLKLGAPQPPRLSVQRTCSSTRSTGATSGATEKYGEIRAISRA